MERPTFDYEKRTWSPLLLLPGALAVAAGVGVQFLNTTDTDLRIAWLDFDGHRSEELPEPLTVGEAVEVAGTYSGHAWAVYLDGGPCLAVYVAGAKAARATIRQQQLDEVRAARRSA